MGGRRGTWGLSQLDFPLILSKDASPQGGGRLCPDIKGPPLLVLSRAPCKVPGSRRMTLSPHEAKTWGKEEKNPWQPSEELWLTPASPHSCRSQSSSHALGCVQPAWGMWCMHDHGPGPLPQPRDVSTGSPSLLPPSREHRAGSSRRLRVIPQLKIPEPVSDLETRGSSPNTPLSPPRQGHQAQSPGPGGRSLLCSKPPQRGLG